MTSRTSFTTFKLILLFSISTEALSQEAELLNFEKEIEKAVVAANLPFLEKAYAEDFRFKHGTGLVDSKSTWLKSVENAKGKYARHRYSTARYQRQVLV